MIKTLSFGAMHISVAFTVVWLMTGDAVTGGLVALVEPLVNTVAYHFHERAWARRGRSQSAADHAHGAAAPVWLRTLAHAH